MRIPSRTDQQKIVSRAKCGNLYRKNRNISWVLDDESYFTLGHSTIHGNNIFYTSDIAATSASVKYIPVKKFERKMLVWICISDKGVSAPIFRQTGMAVNQMVYMECIKHGVILFIQQHHSDGNYKLWPDHTMPITWLPIIEPIKSNLSENPANVPEVRVIEDFWSNLKGKVYENGWVAENLDKLKNRIRLCLRKMDLNLVQRLLGSTSSRLNYVRNNDLIEKR